MVEREVVWIGLEKLLQVFMDHSSFIGDILLVIKELNIVVAEDLRKVIANLEMAIGNHQ